MHYILATINTSHVTANFWTLAREIACTPRNSTPVFSLFGTASLIISLHFVVDKAFLINPLSHIISARNAYIQNAIVSKLKLTSTLIKHFNVLNLTDLISIN